MAVNATAVWRIRPSGSNTNGGGYDSGIAGAATDYSQQNAAQASGTHGHAVGTTTFTDLTALAFTAAMIGNAIYITGDSLTTGWYFVVGYTSSSIVTLDRTPGTSGASAATWNLGGGWADFTNVVSTGPMVSGNTAYVLGSGTPNPSSYTYDYTIASGITTPSSNTILIANDPATPGYKAWPDTTGGMPVIKFTSAAVITFGPTGADLVRGLWFVGGSGVSAGSYACVANTNGGWVQGCVLDQFGFDIGLLGTIAGPTVGIIGCEVFSSQGGSGGVNAAIYTIGATGGITSLSVIGCNIHDAVGYGVYCSCSSSYFSVCLYVFDNIIAKCGNSGILTDNYNTTIIKNNTIDANLGDGITFGPYIGFWPGTVAINNIISNHTVAGKYGVAATGFAALSLGNGCFDYNVYYGNTTDISNSVPYGPHDTYGGANPYVNQAIENYTLA